jgi:hypothetical protein
MSVQTIDFPEHISGTTFLGANFYIELNGAPLPLAGATIRMAFNNSQYVFTNGSGITIVDNNGVFQIDPQIIDWAPGRYTYELWITLASGTVSKHAIGTWRISRN